jgi:hypothetical protein
VYRIAVHIRVEFDEFPVGFTRIGFRISDPEF